MIIKANLIEIKQDELILQLSKKEMFKMIRSNPHHSQIFEKKSNLLHLQTTDEKNNRTFILWDAEADKPMDHKLLPEFINLELEFKISRKKKSHKFICQTIRAPGGPYKPTASG